jgi:hypothetical protein
VNPFVTPTLDEAALYETALELLGNANNAARICAITGLPGDTVRGIVADPRGTRAAILRARAPKPEPAVKVSEHAAVDVAKRKTVAPPRRAPLPGELRPGRIIEAAAGDYYPPPVRGVPELPCASDEVEEQDTPASVAPSIALPGASIVHLPSQTARLLLERSSRIGMLVADLIADLQKALADAAVSEREPAPAVVVKAPAKPRTITPEGRARMRASGLGMQHRKGRHDQAVADCPECASAAVQASA